MRSAVVSLLLLGCGTTSQDVVTFPIQAAGTGETSFDANGWSVTIERADIGFGPIWMCATPFADLGVCDQAGAEWLGTTTVDALDATPALIGEMNAVTGTVRSAIFDYGRSWLLTAAGPRADEGAPDGHSARFVVRASDGRRTLEVHADVDLDPAHAGQTAVIAAPTGAHSVTGTETVTVRFDPAAWWERVDFGAVAALDDDGDGVVTLAPSTAIDLSDGGTADGGVAEPRPSSTPYNALTIQMTTRPPSFEWTQR